MFDCLMFDYKGKIKIKLLYLHMISYCMTYIISQMGVVFCPFWYAYHKQLVSNFRGKIPNLKKITLRQFLHDVCFRCKNI